MQRYVQQGSVNLQCSVARDETELAELHEDAYARPFGIDHLRVVRLQGVDSGDNWLPSLV